MCEKSPQTIFECKHKPRKTLLHVPSNWISLKHDFKIEQFSFQVLLFVNSDVSRFVSVIIRGYFDGSIECLNKQCQNVLFQYEILPLTVHVMSE